MLCFHFPEFLTTPEFRAQYDEGVLRGILLGCIFLTYACALRSLIANASKRTGLIGGALATASLLLGGAGVEVGTGRGVEIPEILKLRNQGDLPDNLNIIGISTAVVEDRENYPPSEWIVEKDWTWPVLADTIDAEAFQLYGGTGFPYTVILNSDGSVKARTSGSSSAAEIKDWIDAALRV